MEQKYQIGNEYGRIAWDIKLLLNDKENFQKRVFDVEELYQNNPSPINEDYAMTTDISLPLIVIQLSDTIDKLVDGNHRLYKAHQIGKKTIDCYYLCKAEHINYICNFDSQTYSDVVNNWQIHNL